MENNQAAFPVSGSHDDDHPELITPQQYGLTKREYFAGLAMQGILASEPEFNCQPAELAKRSIECADALLTKLGG